MLLALLLAFAAAPAARAGEPVTVPELAAMLAGDPAARPQVLDVRTAEEYTAGHIPGAVLIPHDQLAARLGELDRERPIVVYCRTGRRSTIAEELLRGGGYDVRQLQGSWQAWEAAQPASTPGSGESQ